AGRTALGRTALGRTVLGHTALGRTALLWGSLAAGFAAVAGAALAVGGADGFRQTVQASSMVSIGSPWRVIRTLLELVLSDASADDVVKTAAALLAVMLAVLLWRRLPGGPGRDVRPPNVRPMKDPGYDGRGTAAVTGAGVHPAELAALAGRGAMVLSLAWLLAWPYVLPWYDGLAWALLPLVAASSLDWLLLARTAALAVGYLPARVAGVVMPGGLHWLQSVVRTGVTPAILAAVIVWLIVDLRRGRAGTPAATAPRRAHDPADEPMTG
ncbi:MAG TPA: hypothetical protein VGD68_09050, partial [Streptosporangiaceae bacterium]